MPEQPDPVDELLMRCLERAPGERARVAEELCREHPEHAVALRERFAKLADIGLDVLTPAAEGFPEQLGDFRLIERLGGGGMGVVYRAEQTSLGREVALKLIRPEHLFFPGARDRFRREVEAVARLQHPGIVPIYTVGEEADIPFFAMELVRGATLAEIIGRLQGRAPESLTGADLAGAGSWVDNCLSIVGRLAEALEHAHAHGILHRDVKPSNVVLAQDGRVMLFDFGLTSSTDAERTTRAGSAPGTLFYMSPEQVQADRRLDERTDVYSLGVLLYELLTLQLPYRGEKRVEVQERILQGTPDAIRVRNRRVPVDAETVCLAALALEPGQRYRRAAALAADIANVLERRPILARPPGAVVRVRRWIQRKPALTAFLVAAFLFAVGTPTALYLQQLAYTKKVEKALFDEEQARKKEMLVRQETREEVNFLLGLLRPEDTEGAATARDVLARGERRLDELADWPALQARLANVLGDAYLRQGDMERAVPLLQRAVDVARRELGDDDALTARMLSDLAGALMHNGRFGESEELLREALAIQLTLHGGDDIEVAQLRLGLGAVLAQLGRLDEALVELEEATRISEQAGEELFHATVLTNIGAVLWRKGETEDSLIVSEEGLEQMREYVEPLASTLVEAVERVAIAHSRAGNYERADELFVEAIEKQRELHPGGHMQLAYALYNHSYVLEGQGRIEDAANSVRESLEVAEAAGGGDHPELAGNRRRLESLSKRLTEEPPEFP